jgi:hypothetical protein
VTVSLLSDGSVNAVVETARSLRNEIAGPRVYRYGRLGAIMIKFLLWCILLVLCWPLALLALVLYPIVWLLLLPFRILGIAVDGVLELVRAIIMFPVRLLRGPRLA